jgi:hypothetical protein
LVEDPDTVDLAEIIAAIVEALARARYLGDLESTRLARLYREDENLAPFLAPHFDITSVEVALRFAILGLGGSERGTEVGVPLQVSVSPGLLGTLDPHQVTELRLVVTSSPLRVPGPEGAAPESESTDAEGASPSVA